MINQFPYTNFNEVNLDWLAEQDKTQNNAIASLDSRVTALEAGGTSSGEEVYYCVYGTTTNADIEDALSNDMIPVCVYNNRLFVLSSRVSATYHVFFSGDQIQTRRLIVSSDIWSNDTTDLAQIDSPAFTGTPTTQNPSAGDSSSKIASTKFVSEAITLKTDYIENYLCHRTNQLFDIHAENAILPLAYNNGTEKFQYSASSGTCVIPLDVADGTDIHIHISTTTNRFFVGLSADMPAVDLSPTKLTFSAVTYTSRDITITANSADKYLSVYCATSQYPTAAEYLMVEYGQTYTGLIPYLVPNGYEEAINSVQLQNGNVTLTVGTNGDFAQLSDALTYASKIHAILGVTVTIQLLTGFVLAEQITIDRDLSFTKITSADASVSVLGSAITATNISAPAHLNEVDSSLGYSAVSLKCVFAIINGGKSPIIDCLFAVDMTGAGTVTGIGAYNGSAVTVKQGCGITGASMNLYLLENCTGACAGANFGGGLVTAISVFRESRLEFGGGTAKNSNRGIYVDGNSTADLTGANFSGCTAEGIYIGVACLVSGNDLTANACATGISAYSGGRFSGRACRINNCTTAAIHAMSGAEIVIIASQLKNTVGNKAVVIESDGYVNCNSCNIDGFGSGECGIIVRKGRLDAHDIAGSGTNPAAKTVKVNSGLAIVSGSGVTVTPAANTIDTTNGALIIMPVA